MFVSSQDPTLDFPSQIPEKVKSKHPFQNILTLDFEVMEGEGSIFKK